MIRQLDDAIGRLLDELDKRGERDNTLIVFLSDNGGATYTYTTENGPLRGGKITDFEGGVRVPFFMSWEGKISPGSGYDKPVMGMDVYTTLAAITSCPLPPDRQIDGKNLLEYFWNDSLTPHPQIYWQRGNCKAIRSGNMKVIWNEEFRDTLVFNISSDPNETKDLYNNYEALPMIKSHSKWSSDLKAPLWPSIVYYREWVDGRWVYFDN
jgi:arylsulfatase A-like enzyme